MRRRVTIPFFLGVLGALAVSSSTPAADPTYWQDVRPVLRKHCTVCHSQKTLTEPDVSAGLALDSFDAVLRAGKILVVKKGDGAGSLLVTILRHPKPTRRMPLDADPLPDATVALLTRWIDAGAPEGTKPAEDDATIVAPPARTRKLDVVLPTKLPVPKALAKPGPSGPLELVLPVGPLAPVTALAFSPDGKLLAAGCYGRVVIWDTATGAPAKVLTNVLGAVNDVRFSPDGKLLAVAGGQPSARGDIRLYAVGDWKLVGTLGGHLDVVASVSFRKDGKRLASASFDKTVRVWDVATRRPLLTFTGHSDFVYAVAFGPKGDWVATVSKDRTGRLVDAETGKSLLTFSGMVQDVLGVAVRPDGAQVVTSGFEAGLFWWDAKTGERVRRQGGHDVATHELAFAASGEFLASAGADKTVRLWDPRSGAQIKLLPVGSTVYAVAARDDGKLVASGSFDGLVRVWDTASARQLAAFLATPQGDWLALTPEVFCAASPRLVDIGRWRAGGQALTPAAVWGPALKPEEVARALKGEKLGEPAFAAPPP
jgi:hypothetical protein